MMRNPKNLLIFAILGGVVGLGLGFGLGRITGTSASNSSIPFDSVDIVTVMDDQQKAWNSGDIETFMMGYLKTDKLRFASGGNVNTGWQRTLDGYLTRYPDRETMGELAFTELEITPLDADDALVFGRWSLKREKDRPNGLFTLHFRKIDGDWVIVSDHTSSAD